MTTMAFDTLQFAKKLIDAGVPQKQAEVQAEAISEIVQEKLATKADLKQLELATKTDIKQLETRLELKIANSKNELIRWIFATAFAQAAFVIACIKFIH